MNPAVRVRMAAAMLALAAWQAPRGSGAEPTQPARPPERLSQTGLYADSGRLDLAPGNRPYAPQYPLWSDGAVKSRWIRLPEGSSIDVSDVDVWELPIGTKLWKEFSFAGHKVETRMLFRASEDRWVFATYVWNDDQSDAVLAPESGIPDQFEFTAGKRHSIPSLDDCSACHDAGPSPVLGFNAIQLSDDRDQMAPHAEPLAPGMLTLRTLLDEGRLDPPRKDLVDAPPHQGFESAGTGGARLPGRQLRQLSQRVRSPGTARPDPRARGRGGTRRGR